MRFLAPTVLLLVGMLPATADETWFPKAVKASLVFQDDANIEPGAGQPDGEPQLEVQPSTQPTKDGTR